MSTAIGILIGSGKSKSFKGSLVVGKEFLGKEDRAANPSVGTLWISLYLGASL